VPGTDSSASAPTPTGSCLSEDELLALAAGGLADHPTADAHLASCATCSALLAGAVRSDRGRDWGALVGSTLGPYRIDAQIGAGGMGAVYRGWDPRLGRAIAIKVLHGDAGSGGSSAVSGGGAVSGGMAGGGQADRLAAEARAAAAIDHRAVVAIHDVGIADGVAYVAMELVDGESLRSVLAAGGVGIPRARTLAVELVEGLAAAHARGVVHRDLKPENLILTRGGLRILDFGLARFADGAALDATEPGTVQGTAGYMAPEQARGEPVDARADLFAVGAIVFELVTGRRAFPGATHAERLTATLRDPPPAAELGALAPVIERCLEKEPRDRFQSAADLAWALRATAAPVRPVGVDPAPAAPPRRRISRRALLAGGGALVAAGATGALGYVVGRRAGAGPGLPAMRPLTHRTGRVYTARFTHDGGRVVYGAAWDTDPVAIHVIDLASGETALLDLPSADALAVSARGELAASVGHRFVEHQSARGELVLVSLTGGVPRPLAADVEAADFLPPVDDRSAAPVSSLAVVRPVPAVHGAPRVFRLEVPLGTVIVEAPGWITHPRVSPDGRRVAYLQHPQLNDDGGQLVVVDVATRATRVLSDGWVSIAGVAWDPAGDRIWFTASSDSLTNKLRHVTLDGALTTVPTAASSRVRLHDLAADRRALVTLDAWVLRAMAGERDRSLSNISYVADLSPNGTQLVLGELGHLEAGVGAYLVPYEGGRPLRLGSGYPIAMSPSGRRIVANVSVEDHLVVYSTGSGETPTIPAPGWVTYARWLDEDHLVALFGAKLWRIAVGAAPVAVTATGGRFALDPARARCAYVDKLAPVLRIADVAAGTGWTTRDLPGDFTGFEVCGWLATGEIAVRSMATPIRIEKVDPVTGARTPHRVVQPPLMGLKAVDTFVLHAGGERYAYSYGQELSQLFIASL
jgi:eukaryotic-like serine/threonine-protein kinase